jgi:hypothetical protein
VVADGADAQPEVIGLVRAVVPQPPARWLGIEGGLQGGQVLGDELVHPLGMGVDLRRQPGRFRGAGQVPVRVGHLGQRPAQWVGRGGTRGDEREGDFVCVTVDPPVLGCRVASQRMAWPCRFK